MKIIDFECDTPTKEAVEDTIRLIESGRGFDKEGYALLKFHGVYQGYDRDSATERKQRGDAIPDEPHPSLL